MEQFQKDLEELLHEKLEIQEELKTLKNKIMNQSDDENEQTQEFVELKKEYDLCLEENYELKSEAGGR